MKAGDYLLVALIMRDVDDETPRRRMSFVCAKSVLFWRGQWTIHVKDERVESNEYDESKKSCDTCFDSLCCIACIPMHKPPAFPAPCPPTLCKQTPHPFFPRHPHPYTHQLISTPSSPHHPTLPYAHPPDTHPPPFPSTAPHAVSYRLRCDRSPRLFLHLRRWDHRRRVGTR